MQLEVEAMEVAEPVTDSVITSADVIMTAPPPMLSPISSFSGQPSSSAAPSGGPAPTEIVFSFDTTGSMSSCLEEVQNHMKTLIQRLLMDVPSLKIAIIAHGDYCDAEHFYVTKSIDFTNDVKFLMDFINTCGGTGGGDYEECYELVLKKVREDMSWSPGSTKSMVMIGDAIPHPKGHGGNNDNLDWREEVDRLFSEVGVRIYAVQCMTESNKEALPFWEELAKRGYGKYLEMNQFGTIIDLIMAICYREGGNPALFEAYEREVRAREGPGIGRELDRMFLTLRDDTSATATAPSTSTAQPKIAKVKPRIVHGVASKHKTKDAAPRAPTASLPAAARAPKAGRPMARTPKAQNTAAAERRKAKGKKVVEHKLRRENITRSQFVLNQLPWSQWKLYRQGSVFHDRKLFRTSKDKPAIYEVSVQSMQHCKRYVVFCGVTAGIPNGVNWDTYLMRKPSIKAQVDNVLSQGSCKVFARRALLPKSQKVGSARIRTPRQLSSFMKKKYNYAWMKSAQSGVSKSGRDLTKRGFSLAKEVDV